VWEPAVCHYAEDDDGTELYKKCPEDPDINTCCLLLITNSPRAGISAYEGSWFDDELSGRPSEASTPMIMGGYAFLPGKR
jgi:hypothetical protein